jgi:hypothetical protein
MYNRMHTMKITVTESKFYQNAFYIPKADYMKRWKKVVFVPENNNA